MNEKTDNTLNAIGKLITLTRNGKINWSSLSSNAVPPDFPGENISSIYTCSYADKKLRIYRRTGKRDPIISGGILQSVVSPGGKYDEVVLEIVNNDGVSTWQFPTENILKDLLKTIKYKTSGAQELIQSLLNEQ